MESLRRDLRFALRTLVRTPGWTTATVLTLALGIGATTAIFSVLYGVLLRPLPYPEPDRIVMLWQLGQSGNQNNISDANFFDIKERSRSFAALAEVSGGGGPVSVTGDVEPVRVPAVRISREFFDVLGLEPIVGRLFLEEELREGGTPAVVVSERFWRDRLGAPNDLTGKTLVFGGRAHRVVGVMPRAADYPAGIDLWVPRELDAVLPSRTAHNWQAVGRLRDGVTLDRADREVSAIARQLKSEHGDDTWMFDAELVPLHEQLVGHVRSGLLILLGASAFLLLIASANVTNLLLARAAARQRELAVRLAMGAGRKRLVQQFLVESFVIALAGGALGVLIAFLGVRALLLLEPGNLPRVADVGVSWTVLAFAFGLSLLTAASIGLITALRGTGSELRESLAQSQRTMAAGGHRVRSGLVVAQVAATLVLLVGAGLLGRSFLRLLAIEPGYRTEEAVVLDVAMPAARTEEEFARRRATYDQLLERLRAIPGVRSVGGVNALPLRGGGYSNGTFIALLHAGEEMNFERFGELMKDPARSGYAEFRIASEGYFEAMGISLVRGRLFEPGDAPDAPHVAVISEKLAETEWPGEDPIGKLIQFGNMDGDLRPYTVVGIVTDIREATLDAEPRGTFYGYYRQRPRPVGAFNIVIAGPTNPASVIPAARRIVREVAPEVPPRFRMIEEIVTQSVADRRFSLFLLGAFAASALLLAVMGVYSVVSVLVAQREHEMGIRVALGAQSGDVAGLVLRQGAVLAIVGIVVGVIAALTLTRLLESLLYGVTATDPVSFVAVSALLVVVALAASWVPARRATRVDPMSVLRNS